MPILISVGCVRRSRLVSVYTRHLSGRSKAGEPQWRRCKCAKYLYLLKDGTRKTVSAKTRSWEKPEAKAQEIRDAWDPVKQKMRGVRGTEEVSTRRRGLDRSGS